MTLSPLLWRALAFAALLALFALAFQSRSEA